MKNTLKKLAIMSTFLTTALTAVADCTQQTANKIVDLASDKTPHMNAQSMNLFLDHYKRPHVKNPTFTERDRKEVRQCIDSASNSGTCQQYAADIADRIDNTCDIYPNHNICSDSDALAQKTMSECEMGSKSPICDEVNVVVPKLFDLAMTFTKCTAHDQRDPMNTLNTVESHLNSMHDLKGVNKQNAYSIVNVIRSELNASLN
jgi:hypothetical protein